MTSESTVDGIGFGGTPEVLPSTEKERKRFIFNFCGYSGAHPTLREWVRFNQSMNRGLDLGLEARALNILSIIDHALHEVPRFVDVAYVARGQVDSTTAHTKQSMNNAQRVFEEAFIHRQPSSEAKQFQRLCLLGLWMHDYGETIFELTTASMMHELSKEDRTAMKGAKDEVEREIVLFNFAVAEAGLDAGRPELLQQLLRAIRAHAIAGSKGLVGTKLVMARIALIREGLHHAYATLNDQGIRVAAQPSAQARELIAVYDALENEGDHPAHERNFLHAYGKTIESVEGQRYMQKNAKEPPHMPLYYALSTQEQRAPKPFNETPDQEVIENYRRCERRLPSLFAPMAEIPALLEHAAFTLRACDKELMARACAAFTYHSLARPYMPREGDDVAPPASVVDRAPHLPATSHRPHRHMRAVELGHYYRAAAQAVREGNYVPGYGSLVALEDTPTIPRMIDITMKTMGGSEPSQFRGR